MEFFIDLFRDNPVIPLFLTLGVGFWLGSIKIGSFSLGPVTATLLVGVLIGQLDIPIAEPLKSVSFLLFLFAIGYRVGPQFFRGLKGDGVKQMLFAVVECIICIAVCIIAARLMGYNTGTAIGLFAGSQTISASIGVGSDMISSMKIDPGMKKQLIGMIPSAYAVTYIFGTIGAAWIVANLGPKLCGGLNKAKRQIAELEAQMEEGEFTAHPGKIVANRPVSFRAYRAGSVFFKRRRSVSEIEEALRGLGHRLFVERLRVGEEIVDVEPDVKVGRGDILVIGGRRETVVNEASVLGEEVVDHELLNFEAENLPVTISKNGAAGMTFGQLKGADYMSGVLVKSLLRDGVKIPLHKQTRLEPGDVLTLVGLQKDVEQAVGEIGYPDRKTEITDVAFLSFAMAIGCFIGALCYHFKGVPISLTTSGGALLSGLFFGWLRNRKPTIGRVPSSVVWFLDNVGLNLFIAIVGLAAGPTFLPGIREVGIGLFFVGLITTTLPIIISIFIGHYLFRFPIAVTLGCVAGGRNAVAALGALQDNLDSTYPAMGYTVTYAVSNFLLIFGGIAVALLV